MRAAISAGAGKYCLGIGPFSLIAPGVSFMMIELGIGGGDCLTPSPVTYPSGDKMADVT
jgi:hypothetical protein